MSIFKSISKAVSGVFRPVEKALRPALKAIRPVVGAIPGVGTAIEAGLTARDALRSGSRSRPRTGIASRGTAVATGAYGYGSALAQGYSMSLLPTLGRLGGAAAGAVRRLPAGTVGAAAGTIAGGILYDAMGNPVGRARRRRARGITARELKSFTRVTGILNKYCKTPAPTRRRTGGRK